MFHDVCHYKNTNLVSRKINYHRHSEFIFICGGGFSYLCIEIARPSLCHLAPLMLVDDRPTVRCKKTVEGSFNLILIPHFIFTPVSINFNLHPLNTESSRAQLRTQKRFPTVSTLIHGNQDE